jgi:hypothetical protein
VTERKHRLKSGYDRLEDQITGPVLDSIIVRPRSHGRLHMPGEYSTDNRPPAHRVRINGGAGDNPGVYHEERLLGGPDHYLVTYDVWSYRDSHSIAELVLTETAGEQENTPTG